MVAFALNVVLGAANVYLAWSTYATERRFQAALGAFEEVTGQIRRRLQVSERRFQTLQEHTEEE